MRLLLVEPDTHVAATVSAVLTRHGFEVTHARSGEEALDALVPDGAGPNLVLLALGLPDQDGFDVCGKIRKRTGIPIIIVTARADIRSRIHGLNLGADDYLVKSYDSGELIARIHAVTRRTLHRAGAVGEPATVLVLGPVIVDLLTRQVSGGGEFLPLTRKEFDLLAFLAQHRDKVVDREQILSAVWGSWEGEGRTLDVHVAGLRAKLGLPSLIVTVRGVGYRLVAPAGEPAGRPGGTRPKEGRDPGETPSTSP